MTSRSQENSQSGHGFAPDTRHSDDPSDVIVFVDQAAGNDFSICHSQKVAGAFGGKVVLVYIQRRSENENSPIDPVSWDIQKQQARKWLDTLTRCADVTKAPCEVKILEGHLLTQIQSFLERHQGDIAAAPRSKSDNDGKLSEAAWGVLLSNSSGALMLPQDARIDNDKTYDRILVPLDGSARAEIALPKAVTLAMAEQAELVLCYVAPEPGVTEFGVKDQEAEHLHELVSRRNERAGNSYLTRIRNRLAQDGLKITTHISKGGDVRRALIDAILREDVDIVVMSTHGQSGHRDVPTGDVSRYVLERAEIPVLLVRARDGWNHNHVFDKPSSEGVRQPVGTD